MTEYIYIALAVSILYLLLKLLLEKNNKNKDKDKTIFRDSLYVGIIVFGVLYFYKYFFTFSNEKTKVFTNEPDF
jgi:4-hydroxybenzoate polyprenyltransferase